MSRILSMLTAILLTSCGGNGVTVTKSQTVEYFSNAFNQSKKWFRSTDGEAVSEDGPPPPSPLQPSEQQVFQKRANQDNAQRMSKQDYQKAILRLQDSIPELEKKLGNKHIEVGETYYTLGSLHFLNKEHKAAKSAFKNAVEIFSARLGSEHPRVWKLKDKINQIK